MWSSGDESPVGRFGPGFTARRSCSRARVRGRDRYAASRDRECPGQVPFSMSLHAYRSAPEDSAISAAAYSRYASAADRRVPSPRCCHHARRSIRPSSWRAVVILPGFVDVFVTDATKFMGMLTGRCADGRKMPDDMPVQVPAHGAADVPASQNRECLRCSARSHPVMIRRSIAQGAARPFSC